MPKHILSILLFLAALAAAAAPHSDPGDSLAHFGADTIGAHENAYAIPDSILSGDSIAVKLSRWQAFKRSIKQHLDAPYDTTHDNRLWWRALKHGKFNPKDTTMYYPPIIRTVDRVLGWLNDVDTNYVVSTGKLVKVHLKNNNWFDGYYAHYNKLGHISLISGASSNIGLYASIKGIGLGHSIDVDQLVGGRRTSSKFEISVTFARFQAEYYRMMNRGEMTLWGTLDGEKFKFKKINAVTRRAKGVNIYYFFNHRHYSQSAAYGFSKYQLRSCGSLIAGISIARNSMWLDEDRLVSNLLGIRPDSLESVPSINTFNDYCLNFGYNYNWACSRNVLIHASVMPYVGFKYANSNAKDEKPYYLSSLNAKIRFSVTWNLPHYFVGFQSYANGHLHIGNGNNFTSYLLDFNFIVGARF